MPRASRLEEVLAALGRVRAAPQAPESREALRWALSGAVATAAAKAARLSAELELHGLEPEMEAAFRRFLAHPEKDPGCQAKTAIAAALSRLEHDDPEVFLRGVRHVQREPVFGGKVDTAAGLRGVCGLGLASMGYPEALLELADLLADPEPAARLAAARAIGHRGGEDGAPLLRLRALMGDEDPEVVGECFSALLALAPRSSLAFVARFLDRSPGLAEAAALALGASRLPEAFPLLRDCSERVGVRALRHTAFLALATLRRDEAFVLLLAVVREGPPEDAAAAVEALALQRSDDTLRARVVEAGAARQEPRVLQALARLTADP